MCRAAPVALGLMQFFSSIAELITEVADAHARFEPPNARFIMTYYLLGLVPILVLVLIRHRCPLVGAMTIPIVAIFCGPTEGWAMWLNSFFGLASVIIVAGWTLVRATGSLLDFYDRARDSREVRK
jgi:hypothetical protein